MTQEKKPRRRREARLAVGLQSFDESQEFARLPFAARRRQHARQTAIKRSGGHAVKTGQADIAESGGKALGEEKFRR